MNYRIPEFDISTQFTDLQKWQFYDKYSKFREDFGRRETWVETCTRTVDFLRELSDDKLDFNVYQDIFDSVYGMEISTSMRLFSTAGDYARRTNEAIYNCGYMPIDHLDSFSEALWLSICGIGFGYSVEKHNITQLPKIEFQHYEIKSFIVPDTSEGWKESIDVLVKALWSGCDVTFDYSLLRPIGTPLKVKGGYASGGEVLKNIHLLIRKIILKAQGRKLSSLELHDSICHIVNAGVSGGVRRAALLCLFDFDDDAMRHCKDGTYYETNPQRMNANNSAVWPEYLSFEQIKQTTKNMFESGSGEPGIFKRDVALKTSPNWRTFNNPHNVGTNACGEITLEPYQFCNLTSVICRPYDTVASLVKKTKLATIIGDIQSLATDFRGLRKIWSDNCKKDRLLGVNHIGHADCPIIRKEHTQKLLCQVAVDTDIEFSNHFGVVRSAAITSVKPSGNSSVLYNCSPGINPEHERYCLRNVTVNKNTAMYNFLFMNDVPYFDYKGASERVLFSFPLAKKESIVQDDTSTLEQLNYWKQTVSNMIHHNASVSITYKPEDVSVINLWLYDNQNVINGLAFFPKYDSSHPHLPIQKITEDQYNESMKNFPRLDWSEFSKYETGRDEQNIVAECVGGNCAI